MAGNKNSGRQTIKEEIEAAKELITQDALIALANSKVYKQLKKIEEENPEAFGKTKDMALPITLRGITERKELTGKDGQPLFLPSEVMEKYNLNDKTTNSKPKSNS